ncbi:unnamed protein product, partial [Pocillopora meandrina]
KREVRETRFLSLLSDGSTDAGIIEQETVFVRYVDKQGQLWTKFVDIVPLESATPDGVCNALGAILGKKSGVVVQIQKVPQPVVILHCVAHNLELAVLHAVKTVPYLETFHETIRQVFKFDYYSPKKRREVNAGSRCYGKISSMIVTHLEQVSSGKGEDAAKAKGILKQITTG